MPELKHSKIFRGGVTASHLNLETKRCTFRPNTSSGGLDIRFNLASKGGGTTSVLLRIGIEDLPTILEQVATRFPDQVTVLSECAAIANKKNLESLARAMKVQNDERARARELKKKLEDVDEFISAKYNEAPIGEDEREEHAKNTLDEVIEQLDSLSE